MTTMMMFYFCSIGIGTEKVLRKSLPSHPSARIGDRKSRQTKFVNEQCYEFHSDVVDKNITLQNSGNLTVLLLCRVKES